MDAFLLQMHYILKYVNAGYNLKIHVVLFSATETAVAARAPVLVVMPISEQFGA